MTVSTLSSRSSCETVEKKLHSDAVLAMDINTMIKEVTGDEKLK